MKMRIELEANEFAYLITAVSEIKQLRVFRDDFLEAAESFIDSVMAEKDPHVNGAILRNLYLILDEYVYLLEADGDENGAKIVIGFLADIEDMIGEA